MRGSLSFDSKELLQIEISPGLFVSDVMVRFQLGYTGGVYLWIESKDFPRIAGMLRQAAERLEAQIAPEIPIEIPPMQQVA